MGTRYCTQIQVLNLSQSAQNVVGADSCYLDLPIDFQIRLSKDVEKLTILNKIMTGGALGFSVPFSRINNAVFSVSRHPNTFDNTTEFYDVVVTCDGNALQFNRLYVKRSAADNGGEWECELKRSPDHWVELASQTKINELDYGTFVMQDTGITGNWTQPAFNGDYTDPSAGQRPYYWPLVDYGGWCDLTETPQENIDKRVRAVAVEDFRPWLSFPYILKAGFCKIGWSLEGAIFDIDWVKRLWIYDLKQDYYNAGDKGGRITGRVYDRYEWTPVSSPTTGHMRLDDVVKYMTGNRIGNYCGIRNFQGVALRYNFKFTGDFNNDRASAFTAYFVIAEVVDDGSGGYEFTGEALTDPFEVVFTANQKQTINYDQDVILKPGQIGAVHIFVVPATGWFVEPGLFFQITPANQSLMTGDLVDVADCVSDRNSILDYIKAFVHLIDGRADTDMATKTVTIYPNRKTDVFGEDVSGFLLDENEAEDISDKIVVASINLEPVRKDLKRFTRFAFKDTTDAYIESLNLIEPALSRKITNDIDLPDEIEAIENIILEPTLEGQPTVLATGRGGRDPIPYLPRLWDNTDGNRSFDIGPRILYAYDECRQVVTSPATGDDSYSSFFLDEVPNPGTTGLITDFGYATQLPTLKLFPEPTVYGNATFKNPGIDLFSIFYLGYTQQQRGGTNIDLLMYLRMSEYVKINFRKMYTFQVNGVPVRVPAIGVRDFAPCSQVPTPVTFFADAANSECCDLPCGCQFTTCEYYQDFGEFMRQSTLDNMKISSFLVDGVELITTPVGFGTINIINLNGKPYVTNLVDTLNTIGAPYFSFDYSTRTHASRGKRYFTIKRLACHSFKILITQSGEDCYLYTNTEQKQKYFSGSWSALGYSPTLHTEPENCTTLTEY